MKDCKPAGWLPSLQLVRVPEVEEEKASKPDFEKGDWLPDGNVMLQLHNYAADEAAIRRFYEAWTPMPAKLYTAAVANPATILALLDALSEARRDAERYRWLRERHWSQNGLCVVVNASHNIVLGTDCPSRELLDAAIDSAILGMT